MPSTHASLHFHTVFSTKDRVPVIVPAWRDRLHAYFGGTAKQLGGVAEIVGGVADHVHLLLGLRSSHCVADFVRDLKSNSSRWVHEEIGITAFQWQEGYGAFTVGASQRESVREYIAHQEEHHRRKTFCEEYIEFLRRSGIDFDERHLW